MAADIAEYRSYGEAGVGVRDQSALLLATSGADPHDAGWMRPWSGGKLDAQRP